MFVWWDVKYVQILSWDKQSQRYRRWSPGQMLHVRSAACLNSPPTPSSFNSKVNLSWQTLWVGDRRPSATQMSRPEGKWQTAQPWLALWLIVVKHWQAKFGGDESGIVMCSWMTLSVDAELWPPQRIPSWHRYTFLYVRGIWLISSLGATSL